MRTNFLLSFVKALKLPLKLLAGFFGKKSKREKNELEKKQLAYVRNFSPNRLKNRIWQKNLGKNQRRFKKKEVVLKVKRNREQKN